MLVDLSQRVPDIGEILVYPGPGGHPKHHYRVIGSSGGSRGPPRTPGVTSTSFAGVTRPPTWSWWG
jgi:hypothetical protein